VSAGPCSVAARTPRGVRCSKPPATRASRRSRRPLGLLLCTP